MTLCSIKYGSLCAIPAAALGCEFGIMCSDDEKEGKQRDVTRKIAQPYKSSVVRLEARAYLVSESDQDV